MGYQMAEALSVHSSNIEEWADEQGLVISVPKCSLLYKPLKLVWEIHYFLRARI